MSIEQFLSPRDVIALGCLRDDLLVRQAAVQTAIHTIDDWSVAIKEWDGDGIVCLVYDRLDRAKMLTMIPSDTRQELEGIVRTYQDLASGCVEETLDVINLLKTHGIRAIVLKDIRAYRDAWLRPTQDIDFLLDKKDVEQALDLLIREKHYENPGQSRNRDRFADRSQDLTRFEGDRLHILDLHWQLLNRYFERSRSVNVATILNDSVIINVCGTTLPVMTLTDFLMNACLHAYTHESKFPTRLIVWADIAEPLRRYASVINWDEFVEKVVRSDFNLPVYLGLKVARGVLAAPVPDWVLSAVRPPLNTIGVDSAILGYLNHTLGYLDKMATLGAIRQTTADFTADDLAQTVLRTDKEINGFLEEAVGRTRGLVSVVGEPNGQFPSLKLALTGNLELFVSTQARQSIESVASSRGYTRQGRNKYKKPIRKLGRREAGVVIHIEDLDPAETPQSRLTGGPNIRSLLWQLAFGRKQSGTTELRMFVGSNLQRVIYLLTLDRQVGALDLTILSDLVDAVEAWNTEPGNPSLASALGGYRLDQRSLGILAMLTEFFDMGPLLPEQYESGPTKWELIRSLNLRTSQCESLQRFIRAPSGFRAVTLLAAPKVGDRLRLLMSYFRADRSLVADIRFVLYNFRNATPYTLRVPPRILLSKSTRWLTHISTTSNLSN